MVVSDQEYIILLTAVSTCSQSLCVRMNGLVSKQFNIQEDGTFVGIFLDIQTFMVW